MRCDHTADANEVDGQLQRVRVTDQLENRVRAATVRRRLDGLDRVLFEIERSRAMPLGLGEPVRD